MPQFRGIEDRLHACVNPDPGAPRPSRDDPRIRVARNRYSAAVLCVDAVVRKDSIAREVIGEGKRWMLDLLMW